MFGKMMKKMGGAMKMAKKAAAPSYGKLKGPGLKRPAPAAGPSKSMFKAAAAARMKMMKR